MSKHVWIHYNALPEGCPGKERLDYIRQIRAQEGFTGEEKAMDVRECFYCKSFYGINEIGAGDLQGRRRFIVLCEKKPRIRPIPITVE